MTPNFSPLSLSAMRALRLKQLAGQRGKRAPRFVIVPHTTVKHRDGTFVDVKRQVPIDRSVYTGDFLRLIAKRNGIGKGLRRLAEKEADRIIGIPSWQRTTLPTTSAEAA